MRLTVKIILAAFVAGEIDALVARMRLLEQFSPNYTKSQEVINRLYIDEILADLDAGVVNLSLATEGLEDAAMASFANREFPPG